MTASHTVNLSDRILPREGFPAVNLLDGGALGFGGGAGRNLFDLSATLSDRGSGVRLGAQYRGASTLRTGTPANPGELRFGSTIVAAFQAYAELKPLLPDVALLHDTRVSLSVANLTNSRQRVIDEAGKTPVRYQPGYRDPIGRTIELEIRRRF